MSWSDLRAHQFATLYVFCKFCGALDMKYSAAHHKLFLRSTFVLAAVNGGRVGGWESNSLSSIST